MTTHVREGIGNLKRKKKIWKEKSKKFRQIWRGQTELLRMKNTVSKIRKQKT